VVVLCPVTDTYQGMKLTLGRHELVQDVYVMDLLDTNIILGVQWLSTLGPITTNYKTMEMSFVEEGGRKVVLRGMTGNSARVVTAKRMEAIFRREEIVYAAECKVSARYQIYKICRTERNARNEQNNSKISSIIFTIHRNDIRNSNRNST
jgi:hypothetical protein